MQCTINNISRKIKKVRNWEGEGQFYENDSLWTLCKCSKLQKNVSKEFMCISEHTVPESANANVIRQLGNHHRLAHTYTINQLCQWASHYGLFFQPLPKCRKVSLFILISSNKFSLENWHHIERLCQYM